jgi:hypothetical protein
MTPVPTDVPLTVSVPVLVEIVVLHLPVHVIPVVGGGGGGGAGAPSTSEKVWELFGVHRKVAEKRRVGANFSIFANGRSSSTISSWVAPVAQEDDAPSTHNRQSPKPN